TKPSSTKNSKRKPTSWPRKLNRNEATKSTLTLFPSGRLIRFSKNAKTCSKRRSRKQTQTGRRRRKNQRKTTPSPKSQKKRIRRTEKSPLWTSPEPIKRLQSR